MFFRACHHTSLYKSKFKKKSFCLRQTNVLSKDMSLVSPREEKSEMMNMYWKIQKNVSH